MARKYKDVRECLTANTGDLVEFLDENASVHGKSSWLFTPILSRNRICLVAHIDTVFAQPTELVEKDGIISSGPNEGLGADDRAGVWAILKLYHSMRPEDRPMLLFTDGEERGGIGAHEATRLYNEELKDVTFFVELDRHGSDDCVFYNLENEKFIRFIESYGFKESRGSFSDITIIGRHFKKAAVNLSCGYQKEHSKNETLNLKWLYATYWKVKRLLKQNSGVRTVWENDYEKNYRKPRTDYPNWMTTDWSGKNDKRVQKNTIAPQGKGFRDREKTLDAIFSLQNSDILPEDFDMPDLPVGKCECCGEEHELILGTCRDCAF